MYAFVAVIVEAIQHVHGPLLPEGFRLVSGVGEDEDLVLVAVKLGQRQLQLPHDPLIVHLGHDGVHVHVQIQIRKVVAVNDFQAVDGIFLYRRQYRLDKAQSVDDVDARVLFQKIDHRLFRNQGMAGNKIGNVLALRSLHEVIGDGPVDGVEIIQGFVEVIVAFVRNVVGAKIRDCVVCFRPEKFFRLVVNGLQGFYRKVLFIGRTETDNS